MNKNESAAQEIAALITRAGADPSIFTDRGLAIILKSYTLLASPDDSAYRFIASGYEKLEMYYKAVRGKSSRVTNSRLAPFLSVFCANIESKITALEKSTGGLMNRKRSAKPDFEGLLAEVESGADEFKGYIEDIKESINEASLLLGGLDKASGDCRAYAVAAAVCAAADTGGADRNNPAGFNKIRGELSELLAGFNDEARAFNAELAVLSNLTQSALALFGQDLPALINGLTAALQDNPDARKIKAVTAEFFVLLDKIKLMLI